MKSSVHDIAESGRTAGPRLRCFLNTPMLLLLVMGSSGATAVYAAAPCPVLPDMSLARMQGTVYGPSGVAVPQVLVRVTQDGRQVAQGQTDDHGKFQLKVEPGNYVVHVQFLQTKSIDLYVRVGHNLGGFFHSARLRIILGLSGAKCSYATTKSKQFKAELKRFEQRLVEMPPGP